MSLGQKNMLAATFLFSLMQLCIKALPGIPAHEIAFFRGVIAFIICYEYFIRKGISPWGNNKRILILRGIFGTVGLTLFFYSVQKMPLASAVTIQYLAPIFTVLIATFLVKESPHPKQIFFFFIALIGVFLVKGFDVRITMFELGCGVTAAFFSALAYNMIRKLNTKEDPMVIIFYLPLVATPTLGTYSALHWVMPSGVEWLFLLMMGVLTQSAQYFMTKAYQNARASDVAHFNYLGVLYGLVFGWFIFGETLHILSLAGIGLILFGILMANRYKRIPNSSTASE